MTGTSTSLQPPEIGRADIGQIVEYCRAHLPLDQAERLDEEGYYHSLPLCVIDTVFSIGARYTSTLATVQRFCAYFQLEYLSPVRFPDVSTQLSISEFLRLYERSGLEAMAGQVYQNRQRTSTRNGILKAEAVWQVSRLLQAYGVEYLQDAAGVVGRADFEARFQAIPGQASGISLRYFYMLVGSDEYVKPDRMVARFIHSATQKSYPVEAMHQAIVEAARQLQAEYPRLIPRLLDHLIWNFQRSQPTA